MTIENNQPLPFIKDPQSIQELNARFRLGEELKPGEMMTIIHMVSPEARAKFMVEYGQMMAGIWKEHMPGRFRFYEPMVDNLTEYRPDIIRSLNLQPGDELVDFGAGFCPLARHLAAISLQTRYYAIDNVPLAQEKSQPLLASLVEKGLLQEARFFLHSYLQGMPADLPPKNGKRIGVSSFSLSYQAADTIINTIRHAFNEAGCDQFFITSLDPAYFDADQMLDEMLENAKQKTPEEKINLAPIIAMAQMGTEGRDFMRTFTHILKKNAPLRAPEEMIVYLDQAGKIEEKVVFRKGTGKSVGFLVKPR